MSIAHSTGYVQQPRGQVLQQVVMKSLCQSEHLLSELATGNIAMKGALELFDIFRSKWHF